ncbi:hypothetical protein [Arthrobacter sp. HLT1-21]
MDFSMNSSVVLAAIVGLWLIWVAPYVLRIRRPALLVELAATSDLVPPATAESRVSQGSIMEMSAYSNETSHTRTAGTSVASQGERPLFSIRRDRTAVALVGAIAVLAAVICTPLAVLSLVPWILPAAAFLVFLLAVAGLRFLAIRDRRRKVEAAFADAMSARSDTPRTSSVAQAPRRETNLFDAERPDPVDGDAAAAKRTAPAASNLTATELRQAALAVAAGADPSSTGSPVADAGTGAPPTGTPWQPVEVPKPMYVAAAKVERQAPAPLELPEAPKAQSKTSLKQGATPPVVDGADHSSGSSAIAHPATGRMNLDDVLQRRRA